MPQPPPTSHSDSDDAQQTDLNASWSSWLNNARNLSPDVLASHGLSNIKEWYSESAECSPASSGVPPDEATSSPERGAESLLMMGQMEHPMQYSTPKRSSDKDDVAHKVDALVDRIVGRFLLASPLDATPSPPNLSPLPNGTFTSPGSSSKSKSASPNLPMPSPAIMSSLHAIARLQAERAASSLAPFSLPVTPPPKSVAVNGASSSSTPAPSVQPASKAQHQQHVRVTLVPKEDGGVGLQLVTMPSERAARILAALSASQKTSADTAQPQQARPIGPLTTRSEEVLAAIRAAVPPSPPPLCARCRGCTDADHTHDTAHTQQTPPAKPTTARSARILAALQAAAAFKNVTASASAVDTPVAPAASQTEVAAVVSEASQTEEAPLVQGAPEAAADTPVAQAASQTGVAPVVQGAPAIAANAPVAQADAAAAPVAAAAPTPATTPEPQAESQDQAPQARSAELPQIVENVESDGASDDLESVPRARADQTPSSAQPSKDQHTKRRKTKSADLSSLAVEPVGLLEALEEILRTPKLKKKASMKGAEDEKDTFGRDCYGSAPSAAELAAQPEQRVMEVCMMAEACSERPSAHNDTAVRKDAGKAAHTPVTNLKEYEHAADKGAWGSADISEDDDTQPHTHHPGLARRRSQQQRLHEAHTFKHAPHEINAIDLSEPVHEEAADATKQQEEQQLAAQISKATVPRLQLDTMVNEADNVPALTPSDSPVVSQRTARSSQRGAVSPYQKRVTEASRITATAEGENQAALSTRMSEKDEGATAPTAQLVLTQATTEPETAAEQAARAAKRACHTMSKVVNKIVPELPLTVSTSGDRIPLAGALQRGLEGAAVSDGHSQQSAPATPGSAASASPVFTPPHTTPSPTKAPSHTSPSPTKTSSHTTPSPVFTPPHTTPSPVKAPTPARAHSLSPLDLTQLPPCQLSPRMLIASQPSAGAAPAGELNQLQSTTFGSPVEGEEAMRAPWEGPDSCKAEPKVTAPQQECTAEWEGDGDAGGEHTAAAATAEQVHVRVETAARVSPAGPRLAPLTAALQGGRVAPTQGTSAPPPRPLPKQSGGGLCACFAPKARY